MSGIDSMNAIIRGEIKTLVLARLETLNPDSKILMMGQEGVMTVSDMITAVESDSELGKKIVKVQYSYLKMLVAGEM